MDPYEREVVSRLGLITTLLGVVILELLILIAVTALR
jgi:hypothetical protein